MERRLFPDRVAKNIIETLRRRGTGTGEIYFIAPVPVSNLISRRGRRCRWLRGRSRFCGTGLTSGLEAFERFEDYGIIQAGHRDKRTPARHEVAIVGQDSSAAVFAHHHGDDGCPVGRQLPNGCRQGLALEANLQCRLLRRVEVPA